MLRENQGVDQLIKILETKVTCNLYSMLYEKISLLSVIINVHVMEYFLN